MNIRYAIPLCLIAWSCAGSSNGNPVPSEDDAGELRLKNRQLREEQKHLHDEIVRLTVENLEWKIRDLREKKEFAALSHLLAGEGLGSNHADVRLHAVKILAAMKDDDLPAFESNLREMIFDTDERVRTDIAPLLGRIGTEEARDILMRLTEDPSPHARASAVSAAVRFGAVVVVDRILAMIADRDDGVRTAVLNALGALKERRAVGPIIDLAMTAGTSEGVIEKSLDALGAIGAPNALDTIVLYLKHPSQGVRWSALNSIGKIGNPLYAYHLRPFLDADHPPHVRQIALQGIAKLSDGDAKETVREILRNDPDPRMRSEAARYFVSLGDAGAVEAVLFPSFFREEEPAVRRAIWQSMMSVAGNNLPVYENIADLLLRHRLHREAGELLTSACAVDRTTAIALIGAKMAPAMLAVATNASTEPELRQDAFKVLNIVYGTNYVVDDAAKAIADWNARLKEKKP